jgi:hypothetical protein
VTARWPRYPRGAVPAPRAGSQPQRGLVMPRRITAVRVSQFRRQLQGVPLTGGQAIGTVTGYLAATGSVTSPAASQTILTVNAPPGTYTVPWSVTLAGTLAAADINNFGLYNGNTLVATSVNPDTAGTYVQTPQTFTVTAAAPFIQVKAGAATPTTGAIYTASLPQNSLPATISVGPHGLGTTWYPVQCTISSSVGAADTSTCAVYLGSQVQQNLQGGQSYAGGGDVVALSVVSMTPGDLLIAVWTGGTPGSQVAVNVQGTQNVLAY